MNEYCLMIGEGVRSGLCRWRKSTTRRNVTSLRGPSTWPTRTSHFDVISLTLTWCRKLPAVVVARNYPQSSSSSCLDIGHCVAGLGIQSVCISVMIVSSEIHSETTGVSTDWTTFHVSVFCYGFLCLSVCLSVCLSCLSVCLSVCHRTSFVAVHYILFHTGCGLLASNFH